MGGRGCSNLGSLYLRREDTDAALRSFQSGCRLNERSACEKGSALAAKLGLREESHNLQRRGCNLDSGVMCYAYAFYLRSSKRDALARHFDSKACDLNYADACSNVGYTFELQGHLVEAKQHYERACEMGSGIGCFNLERYGAKITTGSRALRQSCTNGYPPGCRFE